MPVLRKDWELIEEYLPLEDSGDLIFLTIDLRLRIIFLGSIPLNVGRSRLYFFRKEGKIINTNIVYNRNGRSKGYVFIVFVNPRDAWRAIQK